MRGVRRLIVAGALALAGPVVGAEPTLEPAAPVAASPAVEAATPVAASPIVEPSLQPATTPAETAVPGTPAAPTEVPPPTVVMDAARLKIAGQLDEFCTKWMGFLATRERDNRAAMKWETRAEGVSGRYVGYGADYKCHLKESNGRGDTPVATIVYREYLYQKDGPSAAEAGESAPEIKDATEVTEIFRYTKGQWVY